MGAWLGLLLKLAVIGALGLAAAHVGGTVAGLTTVCTLLAINQLSHFLLLRRMRIWLRAPDARTLPRDQGLWGDIFVDLYRSWRRQRDERDRSAITLERFRSAVRALPEGVVMLDREHRIEWFNQVAQRQFGFDASRDLGTVVTQLIRHPRFALCLRGTGDADPVLIRAGTGEGRELSVLVVPFEAGGSLVHARDVTQLQRVESMRRDFVANVSHELRTPLTVITGLTESLMDDTMAGADIRHHYLGMVRDQARHMNRLVEDLLTLSRLETQDGPVQEEVIDGAALAAAVVEQGRVLSAGRHVLTMNVTPVSLRGSATEIYSAFINLVSNAVRYTPDGGHIEVCWGIEGGVPVFSVRDDGIGIAPEHLPRLAERFYRVDRGRSSATGGTGLGLAIVRHILLRHQAALQISSAPGMGSTFRAVFPASRVADEEVVVADI
ncbi:MAG: phosphate regulon sensor histidine kinase PhoR [Proteobacteria bacterium]|nr:phosphate regulon sensor histidine kinase PhoR [Pseudomonadota bacterium]HQR04550.1 phosphate regulon sensor histidine kinase PhoR [Rhodocyclaceae bacterium]